MENDRLCGDVKNKCPATALWYLTLVLDSARDLPSSLIGHFWSEAASGHELASQSLGILGILKSSRTNRVRNHQIYEKYGYAINETSYHVPYIVQIRFIAVIFKILKPQNVAGLWAQIKVHYGNFVS